MADNENTRTEVDEPVIVDLADDALDEVSGGDCAAATPDLMAS